MWHLRGIILSGTYLAIRSGVAVAVVCIFWEKWENTLGMYAHLTELCTFIVQTP